MSCRGFFAFLFIFGGIVDIGLGIASYSTGILTDEDAPLPVYALCLIVGGVYLVAGLLLYFIKRPRTPVA